MYIVHIFINGLSIERTLQQRLLLVQIFITSALCIYIILIDTKIRNVYLFRCSHLIVEACKTRKHFVVLVFLEMCFRDMVVMMWFV